jgi:hypothetical protein
MDGLVCLFDKELEETYYKVCHAWEKQVGNDVLGQLEYQDYSKLIQLGVNSYLAITPEGKIKQKNDFMTEFELHKNKSARIIPIALVNYYTKNIPVKETITNHADIFDFCIGIKSKGGWYYQLRNLATEEVTKLQKVNRYIVSKSKNIILKVNEDGRKQYVNAHPVKNRFWTQTILNNIKDSNAHNYPIDYDYYIYETNKIIEQIKPYSKQKSTQLSLF